MLIGTMCPRATPYSSQQGEVNFTKLIWVLQFATKFVRRGGGLKIFARKIIYRKIILYQNHMLTSSEAKRGRWVYERGGLELDSKNPISYYGVSRHHSIVFIGIV